MDPVIFPAARLSIVCISDTHNDDCAQFVPDGDIFVHAGDMTDFGTIEELQTAFDWICSLPHKVKVIVAGNHDLGLDLHHSKFSKKCLSLFTSQTAKSKRIHYLDRSVETVALYRDEHGHQRPIRVYGNPCQPDFLKSSYAFTYLPSPDNSAAEAWTTAPPPGDSVDIWVMHSPPKGRLDAIPVPPLTGCAVQAAKIAHAKPMLCVFGHYHSSYGVEKVTWRDGSDAIDQVEVLSDRNLSFRDGDLEKGKNTLFVNAAWMTMQKDKTDVRNQPRTIEFVLS